VTALATFFGDGELGVPGALLLAGLLGLAFGFWLERAGFGSSRKLTAVFYFRDMAVVQVMFTAIVTAVLGLRALVVLGLADPSAIHHMETFLWPQALGGLVFGVGFVTGGWCPGTALVGLAAGKADAGVFLLGAIAGSLAFAAAWPALEGFMASGAMGVATLPTLPQTLGITPGATALLLVLVAIGMFVGGARLRARFAPEAAGAAGGVS
jgi:hypothetical protein